MIIVTGSVTAKPGGFGGDQGAASASERITAYEATRLPRWASSGPIPFVLSLSKHRSFTAGKGKNGPSTGSGRTG